MIPSASWAPGSSKTTGRGDHPTEEEGGLRRDLGDFQTPPALVAAVLDALGPIGRHWPRVLEPTCGRGHFIAGLLGRDEPPREIAGIEIQEAHASAAREIVRTHAQDQESPVAVTILRASLFNLDLRRDLAWR